MKKESLFMCPLCNSNTSVYSSTETVNYLIRRHECTDSFMCGVKFITRQYVGSSELVFHKWGSRRDDPDVDPKTKETILNLYYALWTPANVEKYPNKKERRLILIAFRRAAEKCGIKLKSTKPWT